MTKAGPDGITLDEIRSYVEELCDLGHRGSANDKEAEAARLVSRWLSEMGLSPEVQPIKGHRSWATSHILHLTIALLGATLLTRAPIISALCAAVVLLSLVGEHTLRWPSLRDLLPRSPSQNIFVKLPFVGKARSRILLVAHLDTQRTGLIWTKPFTRLQFGFRGVPVWLRNSFLPVTLSLLIQLAAGVAFATNPGTMGAGYLCLLLLATYGFTVALMLNWRISPYVPGALDNASGIAAALALCKRMIREPIPGVETWILVTGCEETGLAGAAAWTSQNVSLRENLEFINLDSVGCGPVRFFSSENPLLGTSLPYPEDLLLRAQELSSKLGLSREAVAFPGPTDGLAFLTRGFRGITLCSLTQEGTLPNYHLMSDIPANLDYEAILQAAHYAWAFMLESRQDAS